MVIKAELSSSNQPIRDLNGALLTCNEDQICKWIEYFEATSNLASSIYYIFEETNASSRSKISIICPSLAEIKDAIKTLKVNKTTVEDGMLCLDADPQTSAEILHPHITAVWENEEFAQKWRFARLRKLALNNSP